jgi:hypothetical protein
MHEVVHEDLLHVNPIKDPRHLGSGDAGALDRRQVCNLQVADVLQGQRAAGARAPDHAGDRHPRVIREVLGEALGIAPLVGEVELAAGGGGDLLGQAVEVHPAAQLARHLEQPKREPGRREVRFDQDVDPRPQHLDHHGLARWQPGGVDLGEGGRAHGLGGDPGEDIRKRTPEVALDLADDVLEPLRGDLVLETRELPRHLGREQVDPHGEELAELDEDAAHLARKNAVAAGDARPAPHRGREEPAQPRYVEEHVPPQDVDEGPGHEPPHLAVAPEVDAGGRYPREWREWVHPRATI